MKGTVFYPVKYKGIIHIAMIDKEDRDKFSEYKHLPNVMKGDESKLRLYYGSRSKKTGKIKKQLLHRLIMDCPKGMQIDHKNHNPLDNRKINLRIVTNTQNQYNRRSKPGSYSKFKGVTWDKRRNKWVARIGTRINGKSLGCFENEIDAANAYNEKAKELFGDYAYLNKV